MSVCISRESGEDRKGLTFTIPLEAYVNGHSPPATVLMNFLKMTGSLSPLKLRVSPLGEGERE